jgi:methionine-rich copper-binding protein CopC
MRIRIFIAIMSLFSAGTFEANAHAFLDHAEPRVGSVVSTAPRQVTLWFTQNLEAAFSKVTVTDSSGQRVDAGKANISGTVMRVPLRAIKAGTYHVSWHALSVDTHTTEGTFTFRLGE